LRARCPNGRASSNLASRMQGCLSQSAEESGLDPVQSGFESLGSYYKATYPNPVEGASSNLVQLGFESLGDYAVTPRVWIHEAGLRIRLLVGSIPTGGTRSCRSVGVTASLSRKRSRVRVPSRPLFALAVGYGADPAKVGYDGSIPFKGSFKGRWSNGKTPGCDPVRCEFESHPSLHFGA
jgi:hypothetical protein